MPINSTTKSWLFPPKTREVQFDEKWSYVYKKQAHCDPDNPADDHRGDCWDHVAIDSESRLVLVVVPGARDVEAVEQVVGETKKRTGGRILDLATSDEYPAYRTALLNAYGEEVTTTATGRRSRKMIAEKVPPIDGESRHQHLVRGASERDGPTPQRPEGAEDLHILERLGGA
jgi:hypothetical protein